MQFIYVLPGWEVSDADSRVLHDAISRINGFKVPQGKIVFLLITNTISTYSQSKQIICRILLVM